MNLPVTILGVGAGFAYDIMGPTHHASEDVSIMRALPNMTILNPSDSIMSASLAQLSYESSGPKYIRFDRGDLPYLYEGKRMELSEGLVRLRKGKNLCIFATGMMVHMALEVAEALSGHSIEAGVIDLFRIKPLNENIIMDIIDGYENIVTIEEHFLTGGMGSALIEMLSDNEKKVRLKRLGVCDKYYFEYGGRDHLHELCSLDKKAVLDNTLKWIKSKNPLTTKDYV